MSLVLAQQWHDKALIVTDTLASTLEGDSYRPRGFSTKIHTLPHITWCSRSAASPAWLRSGSTS